MNLRQLNNPKVTRDSIIQNEAKLTLPLCWGMGIISKVFSLLFHLYFMHQISFQILVAWYSYTEDTLKDLQKAYPITIFMFTLKLQNKCVLGKKLHNTKKLPITLQFRTFSLSIFFMWERTNMSLSPTFQMIILST